LNWNVKFQTTSRYFSLIVLGMGILVLVGWALNIALFKSILPNLATMKVNTALGLILASISLLYLRPEKMTPLRKRISQLTASMVFLIGLAVLCQYAFGWNLGIDEAIFTRYGDLPPADWRVAADVYLSPLAYSPAADGGCDRLYRYFCGDRFFVRGHILISGHKF
jgi:hypothetical protein